jgi:hypothetical protein
VVYTEYKTAVSDKRKQRLLFHYTINSNGISKMLLATDYTQLQFVSK